MVTRKPRTWLEVAILNGGLRDAIKALTWAHSWIHVQVALGRDPTVEEVAEWWNESRRTAFREQAAFRKCYPTLDTPAALYNDKALVPIRRAVQALNDLDAAKRAKHATPDLAVIQAGLSLGPT